MKKLSIYVLILLLFSCGNKKKAVVLETHQQWHTVTLPFEGPDTNENAEDNPFLNYKLSVEFKNEDTKYTIRGFYAADGDADETSSDSGGIWQVRFTPDKVGEWSYAATLYHGDSVALSTDYGSVQTVDLKNASGKFQVIPSDKQKPDFRGQGPLVNKNGYFYFKDADTYWVKGGADSPENFLAYEDFDETYRMQSSSDDGEAKTDNSIHKYIPHLSDWEVGDPTWQNGKGKAIIGAVNYLASKGMNAVYFLTLNILGDGKDVWPYRTPDDFTRFDVSKLEQWEIVFEHMQSKGILIHLVLQETENETMLDGGDTGPLRQLYINELIARFGHHLAMNFNLGEENGFADFTPIAQNDAQRRAMTTFIKESDPYNHPLLLHTHSHEPARENILDSIVGFKDLDGLSLQVDKREGAAEVVETWKRKARDAGHEWMITMDEIGMWHTGAVSDSLDAHHDTLRRYVLWGTLLSGAAGVEWYFGANNRYHDLNTEDWRTRDRLWELTEFALTFFRDNLPYWEMRPEHGLVNSKDAYCFHKENEVYAVYLPDSAAYTIDLAEANGEFELLWFNPLKGGELQKGTIEVLNGGSTQSLGNPPTVEANQDWVALLKKK
ncbi:DUF5060 domain-containing protein [Kriegella aquimaris]|uniref:Putative collagen-binding domain of a collagenase n=1 Tax=Kriegella aquimaris TaxID=192904 RepID=A0A1G9U1P1_9FLAO|nr:DUF5060 domain-containing protein [Kriegella aquimaris]SDM53866.1 Putative collagen-binding domain of a collagenase [Kriegella aquimaris]